ncbi:MAG: kynureninase [Acidimicrobiaceae bacterium]
MTARFSSRNDAVEADAGDELRSFREQFALPAGVIYLDGNSLGPPSTSALKALREIQEEWGSSIVTGWDRWIDLPAQVGDLLGSTLLGAAPGQVIVADSTTINLYKAVASALGLRADRAVTVIEHGGFPTDRYIIEQLSREVRVVPLSEAAPALDEQVGLVVLSAVDYRTAALADLAGLTRAAHEAGALILWDLSHAAGAVPLELDEWGVDFAVGGTYKYINAGPGSPAYIYVRRSLQELVSQPIPGWFGHADQFAMEAVYRRADGMRQFLTGTPNIPGTAAAAAGVRLLGDAGMDRIRHKSTALTELCIERADTVLSALGFELATPRDAARRGSHVALRHARAEEVCAALARDHRVITDHRPPDILRLGFAPLYTGFVDVWDAMSAIESVGRGLLGG